MDLDKQMKLVSYLNYEWQFNSAYPSKESLLKEYNLTAVEFEDALPQINKALGNFGVPEYFSTTLKARTVKLDPRFILAVELITDAHDKRSIAQKLKDVGENTRWWSNQLNQPAAKEYFQKKLNRAWEDNKDTAKLSLIKNTGAGDLQTIKYFHEFSGEYRPNQDLLFNVSIIIGRLMEVLARHVDPAILATVADEIEGLELENVGNE